MTQENTERKHKEHGISRLWGFVCVLVFEGFFKFLIVSIVNIILGDPVASSPDVHSL